MALIECKECGQQISDKAEFCPHCGLPLVKRTERVYRLRKGQATKNSFASFLHVAAVIVAIAGLILSIVGAIQPNSHSKQATFNGSVFLDLLSSYIHYTFILWSLGTVVQMIQDTRDMVAGIELEGAAQSSVNQATRSESAPKAAPLMQSSIPSTALPDAEFAICPKCGAKATTKSLRIMGKCRKCDFSYGASWTHV